MVITSSLTGQVLASLLSMKQEDQILCNVYENPLHFEQHKKKVALGSRASAYSVAIPSL